jgi:uncharacterized protein (DUF1800 family)
MKAFTYLFSSLIALINPLNSIAATKTVPINDADVYNVTDSRGKTFSCVLYNRQYLSGKLISTGKFHLAKFDIDKLNKKIKSLKKKGQTSKVAKEKKKLSALKKKIRANNLLCTQNVPASPSPTPLPPSSDAMSLETLDRTLTQEDVRYLCEKAGFGFSAKEEWLLNIASTDGVSGLVDSFMSTRGEESGLINRVLDLRDQQLGTTTTQTNIGQRQALFELWIHTNNPYAEKLAFFLLSVWTVSGDTIDDETFRFVFWDYYDRLRNTAYANSNLPTLALEITRDPLMLKYLNNELNVKTSPNENYARELMELFTLGTQDLDGNPNYTETMTDGSGDIAVAARMLSGWRNQLNYSTPSITSIFIQNRHAPGPHVMFKGKSYEFSGENDADLVNGIFTNHPNVKYYYAQEILKYYLTPNPPRELIENFARVIHENNYNLRPAMAILLKSKAFFHPSYKDTLPKDSLEFSVEAVKILGLENNYDYDNTQYQMLNLGMLINQAPSVFWFNPSAWTSPAITLERSNLVAQLLGDSTALGKTSPAWSPSNFLPTSNATPRETILFVANKLGVGNLSSNSITQLEDYMNKNLEYNGTYTEQSYNNLDVDLQRQKGIGLYYILMSTPGFQLK